MTPGDLRTRYGLRLTCLLGCLVAIGAGREARAVGCGDVITQDTVLDADVVCTGDGLVIGAHGITLDLNGHILEGDYDSGDLAIRNDGFDDVTIQNGTIADWGSGVELVGGAHRNRLRNLHFEDIGEEGAGLVLLIRDSSKARVVDNVFYSVGDTILLERSHWTKITGNEFQLGVYGEWPLHLDSSHLNLVSGNRMRAYGSVQLQSSHGNRFERNSVSIKEDGCYGMELLDSHWNVVARNQIAGDYCGAMLIERSHRNHVSQNELSVEQDWNDDPVVSVLDSSSTRFAHNVVQAYWVGILIRGSKTQVVRNVFVGLVNEDATSGDGIAVLAGSGHTILRGNLVEGFFDDGIDVDAPGTLLRGNVAIDNGDLGIEAVPGVWDAGRNSAAGNGNPAQCLNVDCD